MSTGTRAGGMANNKNYPPSSTGSFLDDFVKALQNDEVMKALGFNI